VAKSSYLVREEHIPDRASFPVIDAHNHLWGKLGADQLVEIMDAVGVVSYCDLTPRERFAWVKGGVSTQTRAIEDFFTDFANCYPGRFYAFTGAAGSLGVPVLIHQSDPYGFFEPVTPENEHYESLAKYSDWRFDDPKFPRKMELLQRRDNLVRRHPNTTFILPHVANFAENLPYVSQLLDGNPNVYIDFSARIDELGRQPYSAREFFIRHQDRILFGSDMPASPAMYRCYFRFLETFDEYFFAPDYDGTFERHRWAIYGIGLDKEVLAKIYYQNALKVVPGLKEDLAGLLPDCR